MLHILRFVVPLLYLRGISLHLFVEVLIYSLVGLHRILCGQFYSVGYNGKSLQYIAADIKSQHSHQHNIHQIYHFLTWRYLFLFYLSHFSN